jgi:hypothetical protein
VYKSEWRLLYFDVLCVLCVWGILCTYVTLLVCSMRCSVLHITHSFSYTRKHSLNIFYTYAHPLILIYALEYPPTHTFTLPPSRNCRTNTQKHDAQIFQKSLPHGQQACIATGTQNCHFWRYLLPHAWLRERCRGCN